jgi:hypothetical protein
MVKAKTAKEPKVKIKKAVKVVKKKTTAVTKKKTVAPDASLRSSKKMIESDDLDGLLAEDVQAESEDSEEDVRLTPKIRVSKMSSSRGALANDYVVALRNKRKSYAEESELTEDDEALPSEDEDEELEEESEEVDDEAVEGGEDDETPDELPDLLPADEQISNHLEELKLEPEELEPKKEPVAPKTAEKAQTQKVKNTRIYKRLAVVFSVLVLVVLVGVLYFTMVKASIAIALNEQTVKDQMTVAVYDRPQDFALPAKSVHGLVKTVKAEQSKLYQVAGREVIGEEVVGQITLYNKYTKSQPLVASTRLLSASGKLYRLKNSVTVPAGGEIKVDIYADEAKQESVVSGSELFTVPGLWEGLQDKIYGQSAEGSIKYQQKLRRIIAQEDIDKALADLKQVLRDKVKADIDNAYNDYDYKFYHLDEGTLKYTVSGKIGEEKDQLPVAMSATVEVIAFSSEQAQELARLSSVAKLPASQDLLKIDTNSLRYELVKFDPNMVMAEVSMDYEIRARANNKNEIVDKNKIVGLSEDQLKQYLINIKDIKTYNIEFYPSFIRQVPRLTDRIEVKVVE